MPMFKNYSMPGLRVIICFFQELLLYMPRPMRIKCCVSHLLYPVSKSYDMQYPRVIIGRVKGLFCAVAESHDTQCPRVIIGSVQ